ncbi:MAG: hypothetical protein V4594_23640 [Bacteroidota bacterium]
MKSKGFENSKITIDPNMKDHSNDPFIVKKGEEARNTIIRVGFPADLLKDERLKKRG